ncbi:hypothetical protein A2115_00110 [Candidatus Woesebacteria bacterium GWA1_41_8]|jgi:DNA polymerase-4|uniref:UmuC domain-containing protein n=1 Tax=Candidatus Woesebacteria bacterium GWA1_41_8 TaxID=1802471 RepID=A0A1F7WJA3_9BACT|nr:MAG: hypothetical protein A2115_00110 [Candidatus Woesebacteria bacterium GWA1_41_8]
MHIDLNSCFATIEQQANPHLRGKPIAVAAYTTPSGCILAPSIEAKKHGIKTGMRVKDARVLYPNLIVLPPDPWKYRSVHLALRRILSDYTNDFVPKSIDEFVLNLADMPCLRPLKVPPYTYKVTLSPIWVAAKEIKARIRKEIGDWLTVSVGIAPNRFLAKVASGLRKPDGLDEINITNFRDVYLKLKLTDLPYIKFHNAARLGNFGIYTVIDFYQSPLWKLKAAFESINGYYWYLRLRGWEIDDVEFGRKSYGNSYALPKPFVEFSDLAPILTKLVTKTSTRLRGAHYLARGVHVAVAYRDGGFWHKGVTFPKDLFDFQEIYKKAYRILTASPYKKPVRELAVSVFNLRSLDSVQLELFDDVDKKRKLNEAVDSVNERWGNFVITPARMMTAQDAVPDRIAFGGIKELEEFTIDVTK